MFGRTRGVLCRFIMTQLKTPCCILFTMFLFIKMIRFRLFSAMTHCTRDSGKVPMFHCKPYHTTPNHAISYNSKREIRKLAQISKSTQIFPHSNKNSPPTPRERERELSLKGFSPFECASRTWEILLTYHRSMGRGGWSVLLLLRVLVLCFFFWVWVQCVVFGNSPTSLRCTIKRRTSRCPAM